MTILLMILPAHLLMKKLYSYSGWTTAWHSVAFHDTGVVFRGGREEILLDLGKFLLGQRGVGEQLEDLALRDVLVVLLPLHHHVTADLEARRVDLSVQNVLGNHFLLLVLVELVREEEDARPTVHNEQVVGNVLPLQHVAGHRNFLCQLVGIRSELKDKASHGVLEELAHTELLVRLVGVPGQVLGLHALHREGHVEEVALKVEMVDGRIRTQRVEPDLEARVVDLDRHVDGREEALGGHLLRNALQHLGHQKHVAVLDGRDVDVNEARVALDDLLLLIARSEVVRAELELEQDLVLPRLGEVELLGVELLANVVHAEFGLPLLGGTAHVELGDKLKAARHQLGGARAGEVLEESLIGLLVPRLQEHLLHERLAARGLALVVLDDGVLRLLRLGGVGGGRLHGLPRERGEVGQGAEALDPLADGVPHRHHHVGQLAQLLLVARRVVFGRLALLARPRLAPEEGIAAVNRLPLRHDLHSLQLKDALNGNPGKKMKKALACSNAMARAFTRLTDGSVDPSSTSSYSVSIVPRVVQLRTRFELTCLF
mmetsp:Transcript_13223/g.27947  ORF Transcript_13223/g.27947 Transcript_13223/m.27947 type:complete len:544 (+) Transcript_13223:2096-3727(+)